MRETTETSRDSFGEESICIWQTGICRIILRKTSFFCLPGTGQRGFDYSDDYDDREVRRNVKIFLVCHSVYRMRAFYRRPPGRCIDRKVAARMQGRKGPFRCKPLYDINKLFAKQSVVVNSVQDFLGLRIPGFVVFTGALFFWGGDILLVFFALTLAGISFIMSACSANAPYSSMGRRES